MFNQVGPIWAVSETQAFATPKTSISHSNVSDKRGPAYAHVAEVVNQESILNLNTVVVFQPPAAKVQPKPVISELATAFDLVKERCDVMVDDVELAGNLKLDQPSHLETNLKSSELAAVVDEVNQQALVSTVAKPVMVSPVMPEMVAAVEKTNVSQSEQQDFYLDFDALNTLKYESDSDKALMQVAQKFEALFVQEMFKRMRSATEALGNEDNPLSNNSNNMFQSMLDTQLATSMTKQTSFGLAEMLYQQLSNNHLSNNSQGAV